MNCVLKQKGILGDICHRISQILPCQFPQFHAVITDAAAVIGIVPQKQGKKRTLSAAAFSDNGIMLSCPETEGEIAEDFPGKGFISERKLIQDDSLPEAVCFRNVGIFRGKRLDQQIPGCDIFSQ